MLWWIILIWLGIINSVAIVLCFLDKHASFRPLARRIPEMRLYISAALGGTPGLLLGMYAFRHKTKKVSFQAVIIIIAALQTAALVYAITSFPELFSFFYADPSLPQPV